MHLPSLLEIVDSLRVDITSLFVFANDEFADDLGEFGYDVVMRAVFETLLSEHVLLSVVL